MLHHQPWSAAVHTSEHYLIMIKKILILTPLSSFSLIGIELVKFKKKFFKNFVFIA